MNTLFRISLILGFFSVSVARSAESTVTVAGSRELRVAVVDGSKASALRDAAHTAFAASLSDAIRRQGGGEIGVRAKAAGTDPRIVANATVKRVERIRAKYKPAI